MIEWYNKEEFMKAPVELHSVTETYDILGSRGNVLMPFIQEQSIVLHIGDRDYDIRDLVYRLLRAEGEVMTLMERVVNLDAKIVELESKICAQEVNNDSSIKALEDFISGVWKDVDN